MTRPSAFSSRALGLVALTLCLHVPAAASAQAADPAPALRADACSVEGLMDSIRRGLGSKSEAYKKYLRTLLRESAVTLPDAELRAAFELVYEGYLYEYPGLSASEAETAADARTS